MHVCRKDVLHETVNNILTFQKYYIFHMTINSYRRFLCGPHTVSERWCIAHCSLFMTFTNCRHNSSVNGVRKQHKHHSTYPSKCHWNEPGHFATFSSRCHFNTFFTQKTASHKRSVNIFPVINLHFSVWWLERESDSFLTIYHHVKRHIWEY